LTASAQQHNFIHQQIKVVAEGTQNAAASETPWTLAATSYGSINLYSLFLPFNFLLSYSWQ
jgi:hypothetical protein